MSRPTLFRLRRSASARFVLLYMALSLLGFLPVLVFIYFQTDRMFHEQYEARIADRRALLLLDYRTGGIPSVAQGIGNRIASGAATHGAILLVDPAGRRIAGNIATWPPTLSGPTQWTEMRLYRDGHEQAELFGLSATRFPSEHRLLVGTIIEERSRMRDALLIALAGALVLAVPIGLAGSLILLRVANRRVKAIGHVAARIAAGDLSHRVDTPGMDDAFTEQLARSINAMLERIEALVNELRFVTDALAHDLRSPLTRIRARIDRAAQDAAGIDQHQTFDAISKEVDGMLRLIAGTLEISRAEAGIGRENFTHFDLGDLIRDLCEMYQPLAEESGIPITVEHPPGITFFGNRELIGQAVANLVDNAIKYGAAGGGIRIGAAEDESRILLSVSDRGGGIPAGRREEAMRKYRRLDGARASEGSGLGLALVSAVARLHGGELVLEDNGPGLRAVIRLPRPGPDDAGSAGGSPEHSIDGDPPSAWA